MSPKEEQFQNLDIEQLAETTLSTIDEDLPAREDAVLYLENLFSSVFKHGQQLGFHGLCMEISKSISKTKDLIEYGALEDEVRENSRSGSRVPKKDGK